MRTRKNQLEWLVFAISAILLAAVFGTLVIDGMASGDAPATLVIETGQAQASGGTFRVPVRVRNTGGRTAEQARIEIELVAGDAVVERAELTIPFVPQLSTREGWVSFRRDPRCCTLVTRAAFNEP